MRRMLNIASELGRRRPDAALLGITSSFAADATELPRNFDWVKLPLASGDLFNGLPASGATPAALSDVIGLRQAVVEATLDAFAPHLLQVDFMPSGGHGELLTSLACLSAASPRPALVLGLREVLDDPANVRRNWIAGGEFDLMERYYDRILVFGDPAVFDLTAYHDFPDAVRAKTAFCGYLRRPDPLTPPPAIRERLGAGDKPLVVVTTGGGHDGGAILRAYLGALRRGELSGVCTLMTMGPYLDARQRAAIEEVAAGLPDLLLTTYIGDFLSCLNAADAVVSMSGSTSIELVGLGKRPILVPRVRPWREQLIRAERLRDLGLATLLHPDQLNSRTLADAVMAEIGAPPPTATLDFGGLERAGEILAELLG